MADEQRTNGEARPRFSLQKVYTKDISFETPSTPHIFTEKWDAETSVQIGTAAQQLSDKAFEVVLTVTVTAKLGDKTAYLAEVQQAGIFALVDIPDAEIPPLLGSYCPNILLPFARQVIADLIGGGGFPPYYLLPVNFDALFAQHLQEMQAESAVEGGELSAH
jgi:preprotein translocase subunit SecB